MLKYILTLILVFLLGAITATTFLNNQSVPGQIQMPLQITNYEKSYPGDKLSESKILVFKDRVVLDVQNAQWAKFTDTKSMEPVFGARSNAIETTPMSADELDVGDIASYLTDDGSVIIHRIVYKGEDDQGTYFIFKGDNNPSNDPGKIRFNQIQRQVIALVY
ncbi:MAG: hypothetical protein V1725_01275 [archaeon]